MLWLQRLSPWIGGVLLASGVIQYVRFALGWAPSWTASFFLCMASLLFFNLPAAWRRWFPPR